MSDGIVLVLGSGETAPTMVPIHRHLFQTLADPPLEVPAVLLDTPYGFQANADELTARSLAYFRDSVGRPVSVASWRSQAEAAAHPAAAARTLDAVRAARWVFAGPGSPSYALRAWTGTPVADLLVDTVRPAAGRSGGAVVFASAAALTLGRWTVPVYEIYKVGQDPHWLDGLDVLGQLVGWDVALVPHFDNAEGGTHDTRFCYLGEPRLALMERMLPAGAWVLGVDEHTALELDLGRGSATVHGRGVVTVRRDGQVSRLVSGRTVDLESLPGLGRTGSQARSVGPGAEAAASPGSAVPPAAPSLGLAAAARIEEFDAALTAPGARTAPAGAASAAVDAALGLERDLVDWAGDLTQSDQGDRAHAALRAMIVRLGDLAADGLIEARVRAEPFVAPVLAEREVARAERQFALADLLRDGLAAAGVQINDTPAGVTWSLSDADTDAAAALSRSEPRGSSGQD